MIAEIKTDGGQCLLAFRIPCAQYDLRLKLGNNANVATETSTISTEITTETSSLTTETPTISTETPTDTTETIFKIISNNPKVTAKEIASVCGITEDGVAYHIKRLKQSGRILRIGGSRNGGEWRVVE